MKETTKFILDNGELLGKVLNLFRKFSAIDGLTVVRQLNIEYSLATKLLETLENTGKIKMNFEGKYKGKFTSNCG